MKQSGIETITGFLVIILAVSFFTFAYKTSNRSKGDDGYKISADFQNIDGITEGADVKISGIKIGRVGQISLDNKIYLANLQILIDDSVKIPDDSRAIVTTNGILGGRYIRIAPGASDNNLQDGGKLLFTQSALNIEDLISKLLLSFSNK